MFQKKKKKKKTLEDHRNVWKNPRPLWKTSLALWKQIMKKWNIECSICLDHLKKYIFKTKTKNILNSHVECSVKMFRNKGEYHSHSPDQAWQEGEAKNKGC